MLFRQIECLKISYLDFYHALILFFVLIHVLKLETFEMLLKFRVMSL